MKLRTKELTILWFFLTHIYNFKFIFSSVGWGPDKRQYSAIYPCIKNQEVIINQKDYITDFGKTLLQFYNNYKLFVFISHNGINGTVHPRKNKTTRPYIILIQPGSSPLRNAVQAQFLRNIKKC